MIVELYGKYFKNDSRNYPKEIEPLREGYCIEYDIASKLYSVANPEGECIGKFNADVIENAVEADFNKRFDAEFGEEDTIFE